MGKKKTSEARGKLGRYADTPKAIAVFRHVYKVPDNVGLKYVHWNDALNLATWDLLIPMVAVVEGGIVMGTVELNRRLGLERSTYDIVRTYILHNNTKIEAFSLRPRDVNYTLVNGLSDTNRNFDEDFLIVSGEWHLPGRRCPTKEGVPGLSCPAVPTPPPNPLGQEAPGADHLFTQLGNVVRPGMLLWSGSQTRGDGSMPLWAPQLEYHGGDAVTEVDCILPVGDGCSVVVANAICQAARLPLNMGEWKKSSDDELINSLRKGLLMDAKKKATEAKKLADAANANRVKAEESFQAALESLTKTEKRIWAYELKSEQAKRAAYEAGSKEAQDEMSLQLPGVYNEFYTDSWHAAVGFLNSGLTSLTLEPPSFPFPGAPPPHPPEAGTDVVDLEDAKVTSVPAAEELVGVALSQDVSTQLLKEGAQLLWTLILLMSKSLASVCSLFSGSNSSECKVGRPISSGITASTPYVRENGVSPVEFRGVVLNVHSTLGSSSTHRPLAFSSIFLIPLRIVLLRDFACPFPYG
uniref:Uncharacterized protein n=1 Tax=Fagus sylvatica TaxID=28930 RepID=A0A2N9HIY7_FAGSY